MVEDYFESIGLTLEDVMPESFVKTYRAKKSRDMKDAEKMVATDKKNAAKERNDSRVREIYEKHRTRAANSNDPLKIFINDMFAEMSSEGLKFNRAALKKEFEEYFNDDFDEEEDI